MKIRSLLFAFILPVLFLSGGMATRAQTLDQTLSGCNGAAPLRTIQANPTNYRSLIAGLLPGDRLQLAAGTYTQGLNLWYKNGEPGKCIVIEGPASGEPALFTGSDNWNVVSFKDSSYIAVRNLSLDGLGKGGDGVKAEATAVSVHHILIEGLSFRNFNQSYLTVGISTKCPAWNWVVRRNTITSTGTGMYFGISDGQGEFVNSLVEHNLVYDTLDYNAQFKHQLSRNTSIGVPASGTTIIRHNTFSKAGSPPGGEQNGPNLLVGHWPVSGPGSSDIYQIYGNLFYENPHESLFQGEGNLAFHDNLLVNRTSDAVRIQAHNSVPRRIEVFNNTVVAGLNGIRISGGDPAYAQRVVGNAVFAATPLTGGQQSNNVTGAYAAASTYLNNPMAALGSGLDLYPKAGQLQGTAIDYSAFSGLLDWDRDFNSRPRVATYRGAYSGDGVNPGWTPALAIKPEPSMGSTCNSISDVEPNDSLAAPQAISGACNQVSGTFLNDASSQQNDFFRLSLPAGKTVTALLDGLTVDYDLYLYDAAGNQVASSEAGGTSADQASWTNGGASAVNVYVLVWRYSSTQTTYQLRVSYQMSTPTPTPVPCVNVALASNGGVATASSTTPDTEYPGLTFHASSVVNGDRRGLNWEHDGGWRDGTSNAFPDWVQVEFAGARTVNEINVFSLQDNYTSPSEPTESMTFTKYGLTSLEVQYWDGAQWVTPPNASVIGNDKVWRKFVFQAVTTSKVRVLVHATKDGVSRIIEVEAFTPCGAPTPTPTPTPTPCLPIVLNPQAAPAATAGAPYDLTFAPTGGSAPYTFNASGNIPPGLSLSAGSGQLAGTPTSVGTFNFTVTATDANGCSGSRSYELVVSCPVITLAPASLPAGTVGAAYDQLMTAAGGTPPYTFMTSGVLPPGLALDAAGRLAGTPSASGSFNFSVTATDTFSCVGTAAYTISISPAPTPTPLPQAGKIAFETNRDGNSEIYLMEADGSSPVRLTNNGARDADPFFSPDGQRIVFPSNRDGNYEIYVMNVDGTNQTRLTSNAVDDFRPTFSPNGSKIAFYRNAGNSSEIYVMNADGTNEVRLTNNLSADVFPKWSPDGTKIIFQSNRDGDADIHTMAVDGSNVVRLTNNNSNDFEASFSPDGSKIVFDSDRSGNTEIWVMNADGSQPVNLSNSSNTDGSCSWSADGRKILFVSGRDGNTEVYVMNADGTGQTRLNVNNALENTPVSQPVR